MTDRIKIFYKRLLPLNFIRNLYLIRKINIYFKEIEEECFSCVHDKEEWKKAFLDLAIHTRYGLEICEEFCKSKITKIKYIGIIDNPSPILICPIKNDIAKISKFYNHYLNIGVKNFVFIDNGSDDGTYEWLLSQNVNLYRCNNKYTSIRRLGWINRIIAQFGFHKWYIIVDSDELLIYKNYEEMKIMEFIKKHETIKRIRGILIDMYPEKLTSSTSLDEYKYFDSDGYTKTIKDELVLIQGGMRKRIFDTNSYLTKYPIIYFDKNSIVCSSHYNYPFQYNFDSSCLIGILHYKFLATDFEKYKQYCENGSFSNNSLEYKAYIKKLSDHKDVNMLCECSVTFHNSNDFDKLTCK